MTLDHLGIALDHPDTARLFETLLKTNPYKHEVVESQGVRTHFFGDGGTAGRAPKIELLEALGPDSSVARFIEKRGPGLHHVAFEVTNIEAQMSRLAEAGFRLLSESPSPGADNKRIVFLHPKSTGGVLVELCESTRPAPLLIEIPFRGEHLAAFASGPEHAPPLIVLHGALGSTALETDRLIRHWEKYFRVFALDFMGHGASSAFEKTPPTWNDFTANVEALIDHVQLADAALFGFSMGGGVALEVARRHPNAISRLAVHGVNVRWSESEVAPMTSPMHLDDLEGTFWARRLAETHGQDRWRSLVRRMIAFTERLPQSSNQMTEIAMSEIKQPTLVSIGDRDRYFDVRHAVHLWRHLPNAHLWVIPGLDHPIQHVDTEAFAARVRGVWMSSSTG